MREKRGLGDCCPRYYNSSQLMGVSVSEDSTERLCFMYRTKDADAGQAMDLHAKLWMLSNSEFITTWI